MGKVAATALFTSVFTAVVVSAFWIWFYNFVPSSEASVLRSGNVVAVEAPHAAPIVLSQQVVVGPAGLALPVVGIKPDQLTDTFTQARGEGQLAEFTPHRPIYAIPAGLGSLSLKGW